MKIFEEFFLGDTLHFLNLAKLRQEISMEEIVMLVFTYVGGIKGFTADNN